MVEARHLVRRAARDDALFGQHGDAAGEREERVQVVRDHDDGEPQRGMQLAQQVAEVVGAVRVQPGGGLVEQQQGRVHDERARQRHALDHAARKIGRHAGGVLGLQAHHLQLDHGGVAHQALRQRALLAQREGDVVEHAEGREQRALLEQHAHAAGRAPAGELRGGLAQHGHAAVGGPGQAQDVAQQHRLAGARSAHEREDLAAPHREVQVLVDGEGLVALAEDGREACDLDHRWRIVRRGCGGGGRAMGIGGHRVRFPDS